VNKARVLVNFYSFLPKLIYMTEEPSSMLEKLQQIFDSGRFVALEPYKDPASWQGFMLPEKELLAKLFIRKAEGLFNAGQPGGGNLLERAVKVCADNFHILVSVGKVYAAQGHNVGCLSSALRAFKSALDLNPSAFDVSQAYIQVLLSKGKLVEEVGYFSEARAACEQLAEQALLQNECVQAQFFWDWGKSLFGIGQNYGEAIDFYNALEKYKDAASKGQGDPEFFKDYGDVFLELARLLGRENFCLEAIEWYQKSITLSHESVDAWYSHGVCYMMLYENFNDQEHLFKASQSFSNASKLDPNHSSVWLKWGLLQLDYGKQNEDVDFLEKSIEKFMRADAIEAKHPAILCSWGEALMLKGTIEEGVCDLKAAERKFADSVAMQPENDFIWQLYGCCYNEMGRYFNNEFYFQEAINKFQQGLAINKNSSFLWHGLAYSHFAIGELKSDLNLIEKACQYCAKAMEHGALSQAQFWNDWGVALMKMAELSHDKSYADAAIEKFENAMHLQSSMNGVECDTELLYNYGCALDFLGDFSDDIHFYEKSIQALQKVVQRDPLHPHARYNLALAISHIGELTLDVECLERAVEHFEVVIKHDPEDEMAWNECGLTYLSLAQLIHDVALPYKSEKYYELAEAKLQHAISLGCVHAYYNMACYYSLIDNMHVAMFYIEKADSYAGLPSLDEMMHDDWLEALRQTPAFQSFISSYKHKDASG
jgi:tetratricopeptide (TPR) repeat protein